MNINRCHLSELQFFRYVSTRAIMTTSECKNLNKYLRKFPLAAIEIFNVPCFKKQYKQLHNYRIRMVFDAKEYIITNLQINAHLRKKPIETCRGEKIDRTGK